MLFELVCVFIWFMSFAMNSLTDAHVQLLVKLCFFAGSLFCNIFSCNTINALL